MSKKPKKKKNRNLVRKRSTGSGVVATDPLLQTYMREVHKYDVLDREEEKRLAIDFYETGNRDSLQKLVTSNLRFVVKIAYEYVSYRVKLLDLIQEGNVGLLKAIQDFNPYKDVRITTYAVWWIRSYIQDAILKNHSLVKIGTTQAQKRLFYRLRKEQEKMEKMGILPKDRIKLLAANLDVKESEVRSMDQRLAGADFSLNSPVSDSEQTSHIDQLSDPTENIDESLGDSEQLNIFKGILSEFGKSLTGKEKVIFEKRLTSEKPVTLQEIGKKYGFSKERARQIESRLKEKLKDYVKEKYPDYELLTQME